jgi:hypothetical protein
VCVLSLKMDDLQAAVNYLRTQKLISRIGLWGRSMGAVTRQVSWCPWCAKMNCFAPRRLCKAVSNFCTVVFLCQAAHCVRWSTDDEVWNVWPSLSNWWWWQS